MTYAVYFYLLRKLELTYVNNKQYIDSEIDALTVT